MKWRKGTQNLELFCKSLDLGLRSWAASTQSPEDCLVARLRAQITQAHHGQHGSLEGLWLLRTHRSDASLGSTLIFAYLFYFQFIMHLPFDLFILDSYSAYFHKRFEMSCPRHHGFHKSSVTISIRIPFMWTRMVWTAGKGKKTWRKTNKA